MLITEIRVGYGVTVNLGNFQSARPQCELTAVLEGDEDADAAIVALYDQCRARVRDMARPLLKLKDAQIEAVWADLPETVRHLMHEAADPKRAQQSTWPGGDGDDQRAGFNGSQQGGN